MQKSDGPKKIRTTGDLREFLSELLVSVRAGELGADEARSMVKVAAQINESFYSEIKIAQVHYDAGKASADLGNLHIGSTKET